MVYCGDAFHSKIEYTLVNAYNMVYGVFFHLKIKKVSRVGKIEKPKLDFPYC